MIHPLLHKLMTQPALFVEHASGYAELAAVEAQVAAQAWRRRLAWLASAVALALLALLFSGVAALIAAAVPAQQMPLPSALLALPLLFWLASGVCAWLGSRAADGRAFTHLRQQWASDLQLLRQVAEDA